jgi:hypothetical protein
MMGILNKANGLDAATKKLKSYFRQNRPLPGKALAAIG